MYLADMSKHFTHPYSFTAQTLKHFLIVLVSQKLHFVSIDESDVESSDLLFFFLACEFNCIHLAHKSGKDVPERELCEDCSCLFVGYLHCRIVPVLHKRYLSLVRTPPKRVENCALLPPFIILYTYNPTLPLSLRRLGQLEQPIELQKVPSLYLFGPEQAILTLMQAFIKSEEKPKRKNKHREIDPRETADFLNRPAKKPQDLNRSLRKSYQKGFFKSSRFEHFKILKEKRKTRDKDSVSSEEYQDEDYHLQDKKNLRSDDRYTLKISKVQAKANKQQSKKRQNYSSNSSLSSSEQIPTSKRSKKMAKRPVKFARPPSSSSSSSKQSCSYRSSSEYQQTPQGQINSASQQSTEQKQKNLKEADQNMDSLTKKEAVSKTNHFQQNNQDDQQDSKNSQFDKKSSSESSDEPTQQKVEETKEIQKLNHQPFSFHNEQLEVLSSLNEKFESEKRKPIPSPASLHPGVPFLTYFKKLKQDESSTKQKSQSNQIQHILSVASQTESKDPSPQQNVRRSSHHQRLSLNSKVIVQSIFISNNQSREQAEFDFKTHCELFSSISQHAPCCPFFLSTKPSDNTDQQEKSQNQENEPTTEEKGINQKNQTNTQIKQSQSNGPLIAKKTNYRRKVRVHSGESHLNRWKK